MRDVLAILGAVLAIIALTMAVVVFKKNFGGEEDTQVQVRRVAALEGRADTIDKQQVEMKERLTVLGRTLANLEEKTAADPGKLAQKALNEEVDKRITATVQEEMNKRLQQAGGIPAQSAADESMKKAFDGMIASAKEAVGAAPPIDKRMEAAFERARAELNFMGVELTSNAIDRAKFDKEAGDARTDLNGAMKVILGDEKFKTFENWKANSKDPYVKKFFGQ